MNVPNLLAAGLMSVLFFVHLFIGTGEVLTPIQNSALGPDLIAITSVIWHAISLLLACFAAALFWHAKWPNRPLMWGVTLINLGFAALFIFYGATMIGSVFDPMPQWIAFLAVAGLSLWDDRTDGRDRLDP